MPVTQPNTPMTSRRAVLAGLVTLGSAQTADAETELQCTQKCVATCIRGGQDAPGLGPLSFRRDPVQFQEGFRSRGYCLGMRPFTTWGDLVCV